jgi:thioredoxin reductase
MKYDVLIIGGGAAGMSCALVLGSAKENLFARNKKIGVFTHQKTSHLQTALFNNVLGLTPKTTGKSILERGLQQLSELYPHIDQIAKEKVLEIKDLSEGFLIITNKNEYKTKLVVVAIGYTKLLTINGLEKYIEPHKKTKPTKERIQLKNIDHIVTKGMYVAGTLAGWRSQFSIACGSGSAVATDILTLWNHGKHTKVHDKIVPS